ncbi:MAG: proline--tRNA ligase [candidate division Zixibacteria bacterium]|nr:proline--tRNA ligase [candidate division Zixibacteria bacterium]
MNAKQAKNAITPTRQKDYPEWYQQVIKASDMAEMSSVRGCMVIKPWGYGIWERLQRELDDRIKATGHENAYFPLFIPLSFLEKEAGHVEGFAKECAVVTHHRLIEKDGSLVPTGELEEPLIVRPTSETIIGRSFAKWVQSYRDLPLLINQWANVVRWEMRPRIFLRTTEFLWQEGHTAHASEKEAMEETHRMLEVYRTFVEDELAMPIIAGEKTPAERFPGAVNTYCIEAMMQDHKALQAGTSHYLGQNFSRAFEVQFSNQDGQIELAYTTSWGVSSRLVGALVMVHADDDGLRLPPKIAPKQVVIIPMLNKPGQEDQIMAYAKSVADDIAKETFDGSTISVKVDERDMRPVEKKWEWIKRGAPIRLEIGFRDMEAGGVFMGRRDQPVKEACSVKRDEVVATVTAALPQIQDNYYNQAKVILDENTRRDIVDFDSFKVFFTPKNIEKPEIHGGFVLAKWCDNPACEEKAAELKVTIRCLPFEQSGTEGKCVICGAPAKTDAVFAKAY